MLFPSIPLRPRSGNNHHLLRVAATNKVWLFRYCTYTEDGKNIRQCRVLIYPQTIPCDSWSAVRWASRPQGLENGDHKYKTTGFYWLHFLKSIATGLKLVCGEKITSGKQCESMWCLGASWHRWGEGGASVMMSAATFYRPSCIELWQQGRGCLELGCKAGFRDLFAQCEEKRPKSMFCLGVFRERMSENSTMNHKRDIINTVSETESPKQIGESWLISAELNLKTR